MRYKIPYDEVEVKGKKYWDYSFKIDGIVYEVSVNKDNGHLYINRDTDPNCENRKKRVRIEVLGGVAYCIKCNKDVRVDIIDYDNMKNG